MKESTLDSTTPTRKPLLSKRFPLPSKVEIFHLFPKHRATTATPSSDGVGGPSLSSSSSSSSSKWFRPEYSSSLLETVHLQIIITESDKDRILVEKSCVETVHPSWQHLNESLDPSKLSIESYETMRFRFSLKDESLLEEVYVHPAKVMRIAGLPPKLPLNAIIVYYTDGTMRVSPALHARVKQQQEQQSLLSKNNQNRTEQNNSDDFRRFQEQAFRTLDQVTPQRGVDLVPVVDIVAADKDTATTTMIAEADNNPLSKEEEDNDMTQTELTTISVENEMLEQLLQQEELELDERMKFSEQADKLQKLIQLTEKTERQTEQVHQAIQEDGKDIYKMELMLEAQRIRLIKGLGEIYPITTKDDVSGYQRFYIRGLEVPRDLYAIPEEEVAAALGFLCHLVLMLSKYLDIPLRFRMFCQASRSAVQDDSRAVYPLFSGRNVDREQFETAFRLLGLNVKCLCKRRGVECHTESHVLAKVRRLIEAVEHGS